MLDIGLAVTVMSEGDHYRWTARCTRANGETMMLTDTEDKRADAKRRAAEACSLMICSETLATIKENAVPDNGLSILPGDA